MVLWYSPESKKLYSVFLEGFLGPKSSTGGLHSPSPSPSGFSTLNSRHHRSRQYSHPHHHARLNRLVKSDSNSTSCHDTGTGYSCSCTGPEVIKWLCSDLYLGGDRLESWSEHKLYWRSPSAASLIFSGQNVGLLSQIRLRLLPSLSLPLCYLLVITFMSYSIIK
jgi:hypothetical protein